VSSSIVNRREDANLRYIGSKLGRAKWSSAFFVFFRLATSSRAQAAPVSLQDLEGAEVVAPFAMPVASVL
jgi:hypothetical protein